MVTQDPRALLASLHAAAVKGAAPLERTQHAVAAWLASNAHAFDHHDSNSVHLIALGKASVAMTRGASQALLDAGLDIAGGVVVCADEPPRDLMGAVVGLPESLLVKVGDHPIPGPNSLDASDAIEEAIHAINANDHVIVLISGGTTSLAAAPVAELSQMLGDVEVAQARLANLADTLLESGLAIHEMNAIRRRVLRWGAGRLAVALAARGVARIPVFAISDVIGDDASVIGSGPCTPDAFDESYFLALLDAHHVRGSLEPDMAKFLGVNGASRVPAVPPSSHEAFARVEYTLVARNADAVAALASAARECGIEHVVVDTAPLQGEAAEAGDRIARSALVAAAALPARARVLYVMGGEPVVNLRATYEQAWRDTEERDMVHEIDDLLDVDRILPGFNDDSRTLDEIARASGDEQRAIDDDDEPMSGGRMQVLALAASLVLEDALFSRNPNAWRVHILAAGTDGRDGPTDAAGAIIDASVPSQARKCHRKPERDLIAGRSWFSLDRANALLRTGATGTNVMDVVAVLIDHA